jgi:hypothetical protein
MNRILTAFSFMVIICLFFSSCGKSTTSAPDTFGLTATAGNGQVTINFIPVYGTVGTYNVYYSNTNPVTMSSGTKVSGITRTSTTITGLTNGTMYYFIATTMEANGESQPSSEVRAMPDINIGTVTILASELELVEPQSIAVDSASVYWTDNSGMPGTPGTGAVKKVGINGGTVTTLASGPSAWQSGPQAIAVDSTSVYWLDNFNGTLNKELISGGTVTTLASSTGGDAIAVDSTSVYWADYSGISKVGINGGTVTTLASGYPSTMAVDSTNVYWIGYTAGTNTSVTVNKVGKNGGAVTILASGVGGCPESMAVDSTSVYWTDMCNWTINKVGINGGTLTTLVSGMSYNTWNGIWGIAVDSTNVYWTEFTGSGSIYKVGTNGGTISTVASGLCFPQYIAVDSTNVYWTESVCGTIKKVSK